MSNHKKTIGIHIGAMCDPIHIQLKSQGINVYKEDCSHLQRGHDGLIQLRFLGAINESQMKSISQKFVAAVGKFADKRQLKKPS